MARALRPTPPPRRRRTARGRGAAAQPRSHRLAAGRDAEALWLPPCRLGRQPAAERGQERRARGAVDPRRPRGATGGRGSLASASLEAAAAQPRRRIGHLGCWYEPHGGWGCVRRPCAAANGFLEWILCSGCFLSRRRCGSVTCLALGHPKNGCSPQGGHFCQLP